jgi:hypothetical protein
MQSDIGLEINPQQIFELAMKGRYGVANERIINSLKESIKKNDVFEKVKIGEFKARFFYFYGTHGLSFSTPLSTFILPSSFFPPLYLTTAFAPSMPPGYQRQGQALVWFQKLHQN